MYEGQPAQKGPTKSDKCMDSRVNPKRPKMTHFLNLKSSFYSLVISYLPGARTREGFAPSAKTPPSMSENLRIWNGPHGAERLRLAFSCPNVCTFAKSISSRAQVFFHVQSVSDSCFPWLKLVLHWRVNDASSQMSARIVMLTIQTAFCGWMLQSYFARSFTLWNPGGSMTPWFILEIK